MPEQGDKEQTTNCNSALQPTFRILLIILRQQEDTEYNGVVEEEKNLGGDKVRVTLWKSCLT